MEILKKLEYNSPSRSIGKSQFFSLASGLRSCHKDPDITGCVLIRHGTGLHPVTAGEVGIIPQNYLLFNHRTVYGNLLRGIAHCDKKSCKRTRTR